MLLHELQDSVVSLAAVPPSLRPPADPGGAADHRRLEDLDVRPARRGSEARGIVRGHAVSPQKHGTPTRLALEALRDGELIPGEVAEAGAAVGLGATPIVRGIGDGREA